MVILALVIGVSIWGCRKIHGCRRLRRVGTRGTVGTAPGNGGGGAGWARGSDSVDDANRENNELALMGIIDIFLARQHESDDATDDLYEPINLLYTHVGVATVQPPPAVNRDGRQVQQTTAETAVPAAVAARLNRMPTPRPSPRPSTRPSPQPSPRPSPPLPRNQTSTPAFYQNQTSKTTLYQNQPTMPTPIPILYTLQPSDQSSRRNALDTFEETSQSPGSTIGADDELADNSFDTQSTNQAFDKDMERRAYYHLVDVDGSACFEEPLDAWLNSDYANLPPHHEEMGPTSGDFAAATGDTVILLDEDFDDTVILDSDSDLDISQQFRDAPLMPNIIPKKLTPPKDTVLLMDQDINETGPIDDLCNDSLPFQDAPLTPCNAPTNTNQPTTVTQGAVLQQSPPRTPSPPVRRSARVADRSLSIRDRPLPPIPGKKHKK